MSLAVQPAPGPLPFTEPQPPYPASPPKAVLVAPDGGPAWADRLYRFSLDQYHRMAEADLFGPEDRVELIEGLVVRKMGKYPPHVLGTELLQEILTSCLPVGWYLSMQNPISIPDSASEPEPDGKVVRGSRRDYEGRRVGPTDVALVVEVSDSSLPFDRGDKKRIYARASIPTYWIVNLPARRLEVYTEPTGPDSAPDYRRRAEFGPEEAVDLVLDGVEVARITVADLLPIGNG